MPLGPRPVYRNSSFAPTRGTNNPTGYIMRANRMGAGVPNTGSGRQVIGNKRPITPFGGVSKFGSTGRSETRSGLAKQAMQRRQLNFRQNSDMRSMAQQRLLRLLGI